MAEPVVATGVMDFARPRCALVYGAYAVLIDGDREWGGRPGRSIEELPPPRVDRRGRQPPLAFASELTLGAPAEARRDRIDERATDVATVAVRRGDAWTHLEVAVDVETGLLRRVAHVSDRRTLTIELLETACTSPTGRGSLRLGSRMASGAGFVAARLRALRHPRIVFAAVARLPRRRERFTGPATTKVQAPIDRLPYFFGAGTDPLAAAASRAGAGLGLPAGRRCTSRRRSEIRIRRPRGERLRSARVWVDGRRAVVRGRGGRLRAVVDLRGRRQGVYRVRIAAVTRSGRTVRATRVYRTCALRNPRTGTPFAGRRARLTGAVRPGPRRAARRARSLPPGAPAARAPRGSRRRARRRRRRGSRPAGRR
jgi:hypothetical protein